MNTSGKATLSRRSFLHGLMGIAGIVVAAAAALEAPRLFLHHYRPTPYDDLFALLPDRDAAVRLGGAAAADNRFDSRATAQSLRRRLEGRPLASVLEADLGQAHMMEAQGWVLPETLVLLCVLAAKNAG